MRPGRGAVGKTAIRAKKPFCLVRPFHIWPWSRPAMSTFRHPIWRMPQFYSCRSARRRGHVGPPQRNHGKRGRMNRRFCLASRACCLAGPARGPIPIRNLYRKHLGLSDPALSRAGRRIEVRGGWHPGNLRQTQNEHSGFQPKTCCRGPAGLRCDRGRGARPRQSCAPARYGPQVFLIRCVALPYY